MERAGKERSRSVAEEVIKRRKRRIEELQKSELDIVEAIKTRAATHAREPLDNEEHVLRWLRAWWCSTYNRPFKDPLLLSYTIEELLYEYFIRIERPKADEERKEEADKIEDETIKQEDLDWAEQMELEDAAENERLLQQQQLEAEMNRRRTEEGDDFGDDLNMDF